MFHGNPYKSNVTWDELCFSLKTPQKVVIYQEKQSDDPMAETIVKIFVQFAESESVDKAREALGGRFFSGTGPKYHCFAIVRHRSSGRECSRRTQRN